MRIISHNVCMPRGSGEKFADHNNTRQSGHMFFICQLPSSLQSTSSKIG